MNAGTQVASDVSSTFDDLRIKRAHRFLIMKMNEDNSEIIMDCAGPREADFAAFKEAMPKDEPRFAVYDLEFKTSDGRDVCKLVFVFYSPDNCKNANERFVYAQAKDSIKNKV